MNYLQIYSDLINKAKNRNIIGYKEKHHILPKSMGGSNDKSNIVELTAKEHYLAHLLLYKIYNNIEMHNSLWFMSNGKNGKRYNVSSRKYEELRKDRSERLSKLLVGDKNPFYGKKHNKNTIDIIKEKNKGKVNSDETRRKMKISRVGRTPNKGRVFSEEWKKNIGKASSLNRIKNGINEKQSIEFRGDGNPNAKIKEQDAINIKMLLLKRKTSEVQKITGFSRQIINKIKHGVTWKYLTLNTREDQ
jgi:hypothetical protein